MKRERFYLINYDLNSDKKTIKLIDSKQENPSCGLAFDVAEKRQKLKRVDKEYTVSCDKGGKDGKAWTKSCSGKFSCSRLAYDCLEIKRMCNYM